MEERDEWNGTEFGLKRDHRSIEHHPGDTHPGTEHGAMCGFLMMRVMGLVRDGLSGGKPADNKHREHQQNCECSFCVDTVHLSSPQTQSRNEAYRSVEGRVNRIKPVAVFGEVVPSPVEPVDRNHKPTVVGPRILCHR